MDNYYDSGEKDYVYDDQDLSTEITERLKAWIDDNFSDEEEDEEEEDDY